MPTELYREERLLIDCLRVSVEGREHAVAADSASLDGLHWPRLHAAASAHEVVPFLYRVFRRQGLLVPQEHFKVWEQSFYFHLARSQLFQQEFIRIASLANREGIRLAPLKGIAFLNGILRDSPVRMMNDIDILVERSDLERCVALLEQAGYRQQLHGLRRDYWLKQHYHLVFHRLSTPGPLVVELHWGLDYPGRLDGEFYAGLWKRAGLMDVDGTTAFSLRPEDHILSLALHARRFGSIFCLKRAVDAALLLRTPGFDWEYLRQAALTGQCSRAVLFLLLHAGMVAAVTVSPRMIADARLSGRSRDRLEAFVRVNTFALAERADERGVFLGATFLLYDTPADVFKRLLTMPLEQFAKFFGLKPYALLTRCLYGMRVISAPILFLLKKL